MNLQDRAFLRALGDRVRDRRLALTWTQQELGDRCGLHRTFVGSVERGERNVALLNLRAIARALRVTLAELLADEGELASATGPARVGMRALLGEPRRHDLVVCGEVLEHFLLQFGRGGSAAETARWCSS